MAHSAAAERERVDAFHEQFDATVAAGRQSLAGQEGDTCYCGGCDEVVDRAGVQMCGACKCTAYCNQQCQRAGWRTRGHKAACGLLARARALPPADPQRVYTVQLKLLGREGLEEWAGRLDRTGGGDLANVHREMAAALSPRERVLFALEGRHHAMLKFEVVPATKRLEPHDLALFLLRAILEPGTDIPTLNMPRDRPQRPYAIWIPNGGVERPMAGPVGRLLAGAGLVTSIWYVGGGFSAEATLHAGADPRVGGAADDLLVNILAQVDPDYYSEDDEDDDEGGAGPGTAAGAAARGAASNGARSAGGGVSRVLVISGLHMFGEGGEADDPLLAATAGALRRVGGLQVDIDMYRKRGGRPAQEALAQRLRSGSYAACVVLGLGSGDDFKPRSPSYPWGSGPWRDTLTAWVRAGGLLVLHGERAVAGVAREFFGLSWTMEGDYYRRTDHRLNAACPLLGPLAGSLPPGYNVKACMLSDVPPPERIYATVAGAQTYSGVPFMAGVPVDGGRCALAAARCGEGVVAFFGDVNWEEATMAAVARLVKELAAGRAGQGGAAA